MGYRVRQRKWFSISGIHGAGLSVPPNEGNIQPNLMMLSLYSFQCCEGSQATLLDLTSILSVKCPSPCLLFFLQLYVFLHPNRLHHGALAFVTSVIPMTFIPLCCLIVSKPTALDMSSSLLYSQLCRRQPFFFLSCLVAEWSIRLLYL